MDKIYWYETLKDCEKDVIDKSILFDCLSASNEKLFNALTNIVRYTLSVITWILIILALVNKMGLFTVLKIIGIYICVYVIFHLIVHAVKVNYNEAYSNMKSDLIYNMILGCKEYQDIECENWQRKQILKRFAEISNMVFDENNAE